MLCFLPPEIWETIWEFEGNSYYKSKLNKSIKAIGFMGSNYLLLHPLARSLPFLEFLGRLYKIAFYNRRNLPEVVKHLDEKVYSVIQLNNLRRILNSTF